MVKFSVKRPLTVVVVIIVIFILGFGGFRTMTPDLLPNIDFPYAIVATPYPGATPEKVELEVTRPLEQSMASLENLENITSTSNDNVSIVFLEFSDGANLEAITVDILQKVSQAEAGWDNAIGSPLIMKMNPDMMPVMVAAAAMEGKDTAELSNFVSDTLQVKLEGIPGVASLNISGLVEKQVNAVLVQDKINETNARIADAVTGELAEKRAELEDTKSDLDSKLGELNSSNSKISDGVSQLAEKSSEGAVEIEANRQKLIDGRTTVEVQLAELIPKLDELIEQQQQLEEFGMPVPPELTEGIAQLQEGIAGLNAALEEIAAGEQALNDAQVQLDSTVITTQFDMASAVAQISSGQAQLNMAIEQVKSGLEQLDDASESAVEQANINNIITMDTLTGILSAQNFSMPAGYVTQDGVDYMVRVGDEVQTQEELADLVLLDMNIDGVDPIYLSDVADVFVSDNLDNLYAKINGYDGVVLTFNKQSVHATTEVSNSIKAKFDDLSDEYPGLKFTTLMDQGDYIYMVINTITENLLFGALFAIIILFIFLKDLRPTFVTLCAIPISVIFAIVLMYFSGVTINIISLSGLAIAVGMLVDNSVVVIENIFRLRAKGFSAVKAAVTGASQVAGAITASTLTTICVFVPIVFVQGVTRQLFTDLALTLAYSLIASLIVALTLVPAMASGVFRNMQPKQNKTLNFMLKGYEKSVKWALRFKPIVLIFCVALLVVSFLAVYQKGFIFMPESDMPQLSVTVTVPEDADFAELKSTSDEFTNRIQDIQGIETVGAIAGANTVESMMGLGMLSGGGSGGNVVTSTIYVILDETADAKDITSQIEEKAFGLNAEIVVESSSMMDVSALGGSGISVTVYGDDMDDLFVAADKIEKAVAPLSGVNTVEGGSEDAAIEARFTVDRVSAASKELTVAQVFAEVRKAIVEEQTATSVSWDSGNYDVILASTTSEDMSLEKLKNLSFTITKRDGTREEVHLADITTMEEAKALPSIQRNNQRRQLPLTLTISEDENITLVAQDVNRVLDSVNMPAGITYEVSGESETIMEAFNELILMMLLGILLVYLVMVAQLRSLKNPFVIMFTIPLAFTGGFLALWITGNELSVIALLGLVMLVGIIVNNAIVLIDYIIQLREEGMPKKQAIVEAGVTRMRPILITAITTILGLLMMAFGQGNGAEMMQPLAIVCIGGLIYATFMTLFVIPILYDIFNRKKYIKVIDDKELIADMEA